MILRDTNIRKTLRDKQRGFLLNPFRFGGASATDPYYNKVAVLLLGDAFIDQSPIPHTVTTTGAVSLDPSITKFSTTSYAFGGGTSYLSLTHSSRMDLGSYDFEIACFVSFSNLAGYQAFLRKNATGVDYTYVSLYKDNVNKLTFQATANGTSWRINLISSTAFAATNTLYFVQIIRSGTSWKMYIDGVEVATQTATFTILDNTHPMVLGISRTANDAPLTGNLVQYRITIDGVRTPGVPTAAWPTA